MLLPPNATEMDPIKMLEHPIDLNATTQISGSANSDTTDSSALPVHIRTKKHNKANVTIGDAIMITVGQARPLHVISPKQSCVHPTALEMQLIINI